MKVAVVGLGLVGLRVARELAGSDAVEAVLLQTGDPTRQKTIADALGTKIRIDSSGSIDPDVTVVAGPDEIHLDVARSALKRGSSVVSVAESPLTVRQLLALDSDAAAAGKAVVVGAGFSPGLSMILARHAMELFDEVAEIHVASFGVGGPACASRRASAAFENATEWRDGSWREASARSGREIQWFADPVGAHECHKGGLSEPLLLHRLCPDASRLTARMAVNPRSEWRAVIRGMFRAKPEADDVGAVRVEVRGRSRGVSDTVVYGAVDRPSVASAAVSSVLAIEVGRRSEADGAGLQGAHGAAEFSPSVGLLSELARRGVKAGVFEGA